MASKLESPDYIFESSWEVCNKVGGIYAVLSTRALTLHEKFKDNVMFIGPDFWKENESPWFKESKTLLSKWKTQAKAEGLNVRVGRWNVPGKPIAILVDFQPFFEIKNRIYGNAWNDYKVDSLHAYGDYDEASMFSYAAARVVESFYKNNLKKTDKVIYHANEWMTGLGALYLQHFVPEIATIFTTHATTIGRSIAGNNKPLYAYLSAYDGDQMARELNVESKHSIEKQTALNVDCFTTVSDVTDKECQALLSKKADKVLMNGFEMDFVPKKTQFNKKRNAARKRLLQIANCLTGCTFDEKNTVLVGTSGRYEYKNKGIDVFLEALRRLQYNAHPNKKVVAFVMVPAWSGEVRADLKERLESNKVFDTPLDNPVVTHNLFNFAQDNVINTLKYFNMMNAHDSQVKVIFIPCYLNGNDGAVNLDYYDSVIGLDLSVYPSYYEPWGYTPMESVAFNVPCITTDLAGFGQWVNKLKGHDSVLCDGVKVVHRTDGNYFEVADEIMNTIMEFTHQSDSYINEIRKNAGEVASEALWSNFIQYYYEAYDIALRNAALRNKKK